jgi:ABC-type Fe3+/spermidine/putrescine transport system ATPase subunit
MSLLEIHDLVKYYGNTRCLKELNLSVEEGEFRTLVGPSGCGKTTTLKIIGGLLSASSGRIIIAGRDVTAVPARNRPCSLVFQNLALFPHMTVRDNIAYSLKIKKVPRREIDRRVRELLDTVGLPEEYVSKFPSQLSGGEQQRVALSRSLAYDPAILLLDEPLTAVDFKLRKQLRKTLSDLHRKIGKTFIYVTHSLEEALSLSDTITVLKDGEELQTGTPETIYLEPKSRFVAEFLGDANTFEVEWVGDEKGSYRLYCARLDRYFETSALQDVWKGYLIVRAFEIGLSEESTGPNSIPVRVFNRYDKGGTIEYALVHTTDRGEEVHLTAEVLKEKQRSIEIGAYVYAEWSANTGVIVKS